MSQTILAGGVNGLLPADRGHEDFYENIAQIFLDGLKNARDTLEQVSGSLQGADRNKVLYLKQQIENFLERLEKQKKAGLLGKIFKALGILGVILSALMTCIAPTPVTVALFVVTLVMFIEPMVAGDNSIIQKGMSELMKAMSEVFGEAGGIAMAVIIFAVVTAVCTALASKAIASFGASLASGSSRLSQMLDKLPGFMRNLCSLDLTPEQSTALMLFLEGIEASLSMARGAVQIPMGILNLDVAKLMHAFEVDGAMADFVTNMMSKIEQDVESLVDHILMLINSLLDNLGPRG